MNKTLLFIFLITCFVFNAGARQILVTSAFEINGKNWVAGDTIVMQNGQWHSQSIILKGIGTENNPVVLMAQTAGQVILTGSSYVDLSGKFVEVSGLYFKDGTLSGRSVISFRTSTSEKAENCIVKNTAIVNYNPALNTVDSKWVSMYGKNNTVRNCTFENKTNAGTLLVVWLEANVIPAHTIENNHFGFRNSNLDGNGAELNGQEIIRIGDSSTSMQNANCIVTGNFFEKCNGEIEVISNKSGGNYYSNNVLFECKGMLTLRHGNNCTVDGNYFIGNNISNTGGVRIIGENHKVYNNYFENLTGTNYRSAICMVRGKENSALNDYFQVKNALVAFNTMVNCTQSFSINYQSSSSYTMPPIGTVIAHNHVFNTLSSKTNVVIEQNNIAALDVTWKNNIMNQGKYTNFNYTTQQVQTGIDAKMTLAGTKPNILEPATNSGLLQFAVNEYPEIINDLRGRNRGELKIPGSSQITGSTSKISPIKETAGAFFLMIPTNSQKAINNNTLKIFTRNNFTYTEVNENGLITVFDLNGSKVYSKNINSGINSIELKGRGVYIVNFKSESGKNSSGKILLNNI